MDQEGDIRSAIPIFAQQAAEISCLFLPYDEVPCIYFSLIFSP